VSKQEAPQIVPEGDGRFRLEDGTRQRVAYAVAGTAGAVWIFVDGRTYVVNTAPSTRPRRGAHHDDETALSSPMPASVVAITVKPGQVVARGDVLIMLEAMKMELPIKAPRDGTVKSVACRAGELVQPGVPLIELE
jgi:3-methylcrotonyl-CoA carboxylase alpha subunit